VWWVSRTALVYRGGAACAGCPEALADLLRSSCWGFDVRYVGEEEELPLTASALAGADLYAQPGGGDDLRQAYRRVKEAGPAIRQYVRSGGRYLGICMGGYLAGHRPGFRLLPEDTAQFIASRGASVTTEEDTVVEVRWRGQRRRMYFQDGPLFRLPPGPIGATVLARYASNGEIAAMVAPCGRGRVGVCGPHPEATETWYRACGLPWDEPPAAPLGHDLLEVLLSG
jgi:glutamine amidotransferase-like uncharacterized protein